MCFLIANSLLCAVAWSAEAEITYPSSGYQLGRGYRAESLGLTIGGYLNVNYERVENQTGQLLLDDLSLFLSWRAGSRLRFFSELELENPATLQGSTLHNNDYRFNLERLYADVLLTEQSTLRLGKFLTPVGRWNEIHATPLVWTVTRPLVTDFMAFSTHATGLMLYGNVGLEPYDLDYQIYLDDTQDLDPKINLETSFQNAIGGHWNLNWSDRLRFGASYVNFQTRDSLTAERLNLFGVDFLWAQDGTELSGELLYRLGNHHHNDEKGLYLQAVTPVLGRLYGVARYEYFDQGQTPDELHVGVTGLAYRPSPPIVFKLEYRFGHRNQNLAPSGLFASFAVLF